MIKTYNILSVLLDYPSQELWESLSEAKPLLADDGLLSDESLAAVDQFLSYVHGFSDLRSWQADYSALFDTSTKTNLYLFDFVYGTSKDRGQAMVDLTEEYLRAGLMPDEHELPDYLPMYLQYVANMEKQQEADAAMNDVHRVLVHMKQKFEKEKHPYAPLINILEALSQRGLQQQDS